MVSFKQKSAPPTGGLKKVENQPIIVTQNLLEWMGFKGKDNSIKQFNFSKVLRSHKIPYDEIGYDHPLVIEYPCVQREAQLIPANNITRKKWICMDVRAFKKAVLRLNTENSEIVRDYYLNLEEAMFAYGEYTMRYMIEETERTRKVQDSQLIQAMEQLAIKDKSHEEETKELRDKLVKAERKAIRVNKFMKRITIKERKMEWIYLERLWKVGSTIRLSSRIGGYHTGRAKGVPDWRTH
jgi:hypothetical protein